MVILNFSKVLSLKNFTGKQYGTANDVFRFIKNNMFHRYYGPAIIWDDGAKKWYFENISFSEYNQKYNQKQFCKDLNKKWLS